MAKEIIIVPSSEPLQSSTQHSAFTERKLHISIVDTTNRQVQDMTSIAAKAQEDAAVARYVTPVRIVMQYTAAVIIVFLAFLGMLSYYTQWNTEVVKYVIFAGSAAIGPPVAIFLSKLAGRLLPADKG